MELRYRLEIAASNRFSLGDHRMLALDSCLNDDGQPHDRREYGALSNSGSTVIRVAARYN